MVAIRDCYRQIADIRLHLSRFVAPSVCLGDKIYECNSGTDSKASVTRSKPSVLSSSTMAGAI